jgi:phosphatidylglycerol:prolipoprotein diacylglycerol transferase
LRARAIRLRARTVSGSAVLHPPLLAEITFPGWDPVALHLGPIQLRWYGLGYLAGFLAAGWALDKLGRDGFVALTKNKVSDLIGWLVFGVLIGGRLGYATFYEPSLWLHPLELAKIWQGGLSFHGGLLGVVVTSALFARHHGIPWRRLADALSLAVPFGIFFVRCANFVNGELYGRLAPAWLPWAMRFPTDPAARSQSPELTAGGSLHWHDAYLRLRASGQWARLAEQVPLRHPSQLYEAGLEGLLTGVVLWLVYRARGPAGLPNGRIASLFLLLYALARFGLEFTRQPDAQLGLVLGPFSMGQLLSVAVLVGAAAILMWPGSGAARTAE